MEEIPRDLIMSVLAEDGKPSRAMVLLLDKVISTANQTTHELKAIGSSVDSLHTELTSHMGKEELEDKGIAEKIQALSDKIDSFAPIKSAFILNADGTRDYDGHKLDHSRRVTDDVETKAKWKKYQDWVAEVVVKGMAYGMIGLVVLGMKDWVIQQVASTVSPQQHIESKK